MRTFMHFCLEAVVSRRREIGDVEVRLEPVRTHNNLQTLVKMVFPSVEEGAIDDLWTFMRALREYPVGDRIRLELSNDGEDLEIQAAVWDTSLPRTYLSFEETNLPRDKFSTLIGMTFPHLPKESLENLWRGATALFKEIRKLGYERARLEMGLEREREEKEKKKRVGRIKVKGR